MSEILSGFLKLMTSYPRKQSGEMLSKQEKQEETSEEEQDKVEQKEARK
jgi:hypothetical protein